ncbi:MAG: TadE/TadG family type IV pilus assembly protein [Acidobacteriota bacterium]
MARIRRGAARIEAGCGGEEGSTLVEMAMVMPILLVVLTGVFSFGVALNQYLVLTNAVNNGARAFAMSSSSQNGGKSIAPNYDPCTYAATTIQSSASNLTASSLNYTITYTTYGGTPGGTGTTTTFTGTGSSAPSCSTLAMWTSDQVKIQATYPVTPVLFGWASKQLSLSATSMEFVQ